MTFRLPPSSSHRWVNCALTIPAAQAYPEPPEGDEAREGTCAAWVAQTVLSGGAADCSALIGQAHTNGHPVTAEMAAIVQDYINMILKRGGTTSCEKFVTLSTDPLIAGTTDLSATVGDTPVLYVDDLKYGMEIVEVRKNTQIVIYAGAILRNYPPGTFNLVQLGIYQPRAFHRDGIYRKWVVSVADLLRMCDEIVEAGRRAYAPNPTANVGEWCKYCPIATRCEALAHTNYSRISLVQSQAHRDMTPIEISRELDFLEEADATLKARKKAVEAEAMERARREVIPGRKLEMGKGKKRFNIPAWLVKAVTGVDPMTEPGVCTPAELIRRGASKEAVNAMSFTPDTGMKLVKMNDNFIATAFGEDT
ncbi:DUF2800 domain-containing protein [Rhizobium leguminosarum]|uniref:DUF2800 domain-containing protein n=1 Tax=Rhizobium leguminosarum TaxID=384 RepID=UPI0014410CD9|nr:DUF2800 domain-containing protein [Rhizobium leguminosarum]MBY5863284.1 DUF2800 domain-containing protein [Rhizobium leguminosarum]NKM04163.1 DUF2800 domain-containing protein [Rhizobium leguminosarum bv. viciae]